MSRITSQNWRSVLSAALVAILLSSSISFATVLRPGQGGIQGDFDLILPIPGAVVSEFTRMFHIDYLNMSQPGFELIAPEFVDGGVTSRVIRDNESGRLSFSYNFTFPEQRHSGTEQSALLWQNFNGFETDVRHQAGSRFLLGRSADGQKLSQDNITPGNAGLLPVAIFTNATSFDRNGSLLIHLGDEVLVRDVNDPQHTELGFASGDFLLNGAFEPTAGAAIPLPAGAWGFMAILPLAATVLRRFKLRQSIG
jgi:hypothetical protein